MTTFKAALAICGLSQADAVQFLDARPDTVEKWSRGASTPPPGIWQELSTLYRRIEHAADLTSSNIEPELIDRQAMNRITANNGAGNLPGSGHYIAGAMALLLAIQDDD